MKKFLLCYFMVLFSQNIFASSDEAFDTELKKPSCSPTMYDALKKISERGKRPRVEGADDPENLGRPRKKRRTSIIADPVFPVIGFENFHDLPTVLDSLPLPDHFGLEEESSNPGSSDVNSPCIWTSEAEAEEEDNFFMMGFMTVSGFR